MISDVLREAEIEIAAYLNDYPSAYEGPLRDEIVELLRHMDRVRMLPGMDTPPDPIAASTHAALYRAIDGPDITLSRVLGSGR